MLVWNRDILLSVLLANRNQGGGIETEWFFFWQSHTSTLAVAQ